MYLSAIAVRSPDGYRAGRRVPQAGHQRNAMPRMPAIDDSSSPRYVHAWARQSGADRVDDELCPR